MKVLKSIVFLFTVLLINSCITQKQIKKSNSFVENDADFTIAFGSCNKTTLDNLYWDDILAVKPDVFIWGGDVVYADTRDMQKMERFYNNQKSNPDYKKVIKTIPIMGTWDNHDYGLNDGGVEFKQKKQSQQLFLDFLDVPEDDVRRKREGVYFSEDYPVSGKVIKIIILDTRYFRTALTEANQKGKRYKPNTYGEGTMLGTAQWKWLQDELTNGNADYNIIMSSIQYLSEEHGFETWGNFPHEKDKFEKLLTESKAKNVIILSGDRHISEFSKKNIKGLDYPLIDFTSSGLTHSYSSFEGEPNKYRAGDVISETSYGLLKFYFDNEQVKFEIDGDNGSILEELEQVYN